MKHAYDPTRSADFYYLGLSNIDYMVNLGQNTTKQSQLNLKKMADSFLKSNRCLILIDHEALPCKQFGPGEMIPEEKTIEDLIAISSDMRNIVCIMSNQSKEYLEKIFKRCPKLWLAAEDGYHYRCSASGGW